MNIVLQIMILYIQKSSLYDFLLNLSYIGMCNFYKLYMCKSLLCLLKGIIYTQALVLLRNTQ